MNKYVPQMRFFWLWIAVSIVCTGGSGQVDVIGASFGDIIEVEDGFPSVMTDLRPEIQVEKTANVSSGAPGAVVKFVIEVTNTGKIEFDHVSLQDWLSGGLDYLEDNRSGDFQEQKVTWDLGPLAAGQSKSVELTARISGTQLGSLTNHVNVSGTLSSGRKLVDEDQVDVEVTLQGGIINITIPEPSDQPLEVGENVVVVTPPGVGKDIKLFLRELQIDLRRMDLPTFSLRPVI